MGRGRRALIEHDVLRSASERKGVERRGARDIRDIRICLDHICITNSLIENPDI